MAKKQHGGKRDGAGRPVGPEGPKVAVTGTIPESLAQSLDAYAAEQQITRSEALTQAVRKLVGKRKASAKS
jgi:hypothetical protein